jgi:hypothetical protein
MVGLTYGWVENKDGSCSFHSFSEGPIAVVHRSLQDPEQWIARFWQDPSIAHTTHPTKEAAIAWIEQQLRCTATQ